MAFIPAHNLYPPMYFVNMKIFYELWVALSLPAQV